MTCTAKGLEGTVWQRSAPRASSHTDARTNMCILYNIVSGVIVKNADPARPD